MITQDLNVDARTRHAGSVWQDSLITREEYNTTVGVITQEWRDALRAEYLPDLSDAAWSAVFSYAWEQGHSSGYAEVESYLIDLVQLVRAVQEN